VYYNGDIVMDMVNYAMGEYKDIDIRNSKKKFRQREYEKMIVADICRRCYNITFDDPVDILEDYELIYTHLVHAYKNDVYEFQLNVICKLLAFLRKRDPRYA